MSTGNRYPAVYMIRAREMFRAGWTHADIARHLGREFGREPSKHIVGMWVNPSLYRRKLNAQTARRRRQAPVPRWALVRMRRMAALRDEGLTYSAVALVMRLDFGVELSPETVRYSLENESVPREFARVRGLAGVLGEPKP